MLAYFLDHFYRRAAFSWKRRLARRTRDASATARAADDFPAEVSTARATRSSRERNSSMRNGLVTLVHRTHTGDLQCRLDRSVLRQHYNGDFRMPVVHVFQQFHSV